jgi:hypothetical protein
MHLSIDLILLHHKNKIRMFKIKEMTIHLHQNILKVYLDIVLMFTKKKRKYLYHNFLN